MTSEAALITEAVASKLLERVLNRWFLDSDTSRTQLRALAGRTIALRLEPLGFEICLLPTPDGLQILAASGMGADATLSGSAAAFARLGLGRVPHRSLASGELRIDGDLQVANALRHLFIGAAQDWRDRFTALIGPIIAGHLAGVADATRAWTEHTAATVREDVTEFLQEEVREVPALAEGDAFLSEVDRLREDCDRLEARILRLRTTAATSPATPG